MVQKLKKHCKTTSCRETVFSEVFGDFSSSHKVVPPCTTLNLPFLICIFNLFLTIFYGSMTTVTTDAPHMVHGWCTLKLLIHYFLNVLFHPARVFFENLSLLFLI